MIVSRVKNTSNIDIPLFLGEVSMLPFDISNLEGLPLQFKKVVTDMLKNIPSLTGTAFFTVHGRVLKAKETLRRGGPHTDGNYEPVHMSFGGGGGWKIGENGPSVDSDLHKRQYLSDRGGIILASNYPACLGWVGEYANKPSVGGDCSHINLGKSFKLEAGEVYYGNNHFIHESLGVKEDVHRVFLRITLPEHHRYEQ